MAKRLYKNKVLMTALTLVAITAIGGALYVKHGRDERAAVEKKAQENHARLQDPADKSTSSSSTSSSSTKTTAATPGVKLAAPDLSMSSGNNGPVPPNVNIEFTCQAPAGLTCQVKLTDANNTSNVITLESKKITEDGTGRPSVIWDWNSVKGSWKVVAIASDEKGNTSSSGTLNLVVQ